MKHYPKTPYSLRMEGFYEQECLHCGLDIKKISRFSMWANAIVHGVLTQFNYECEGR